MLKIDMLKILPVCFMTAVVFCCAVTEAASAAVPPGAAIMLPVVFPCSASPAVAVASVSSAASPDVAVASAVSSAASSAAVEAAADLPLDSSFTSSEILRGDAIFERINNKSYRDNDDISLSELRYLQVLIHTYDGRTEEGEIIVNEEIAEDVLAIFKELYLADYPIAKMRLIDDYWTGDGGSTDSASMSDNNTSAFCYRTKTNSSSLSNHALGYAIDINPLDNPYIYTRSDGTRLIDPADAPAPDDRSGAHAISHEDLAYRLFTEHGFLWGGDWNNPKDYQHFEYIR